MGGITIPGVIQPEVEDSALLERVDQEPGEINVISYNLTRMISTLSFSVEIW